MRAVDLTDPSQVSPGIAGFLTVFVLAVATWLLLRSMIRHLRKVRYQAEREAAEAEALAAAEVKAEATTKAAQSAATSAARSPRKPGPKRR